MNAQFFPPRARVAWHLETWTSCFGLFMLFLIAVTSICQGFGWPMNHSGFGNWVPQPQSRIWSMISWWKNYMFPDQHMLICEIRGSCCLEVQMQFDCRLSSVVGDTSSVPRKSLKLPFLQELTMKRCMFSRGFVHTRLERITQGLVFFIR